MENFADRIPIETITYRSEKTRSEAVNKAESRAKQLTKETGRKHGYRHAEKVERTVYEVFAIEREPIELTVAPLKESAIDRAEKDARATIERVRLALEEVGGDLTQAAPYPSSHDSWSNAYQLQRYKHNLYQGLSKSRERHQSYSTRQPYFVEMDDVRCEKFVERRKREAAEQYDEFVAKLIGKIGHVTKADLEGNHVWSYSILTVTKVDGTIERWQTQQIVNVSKLGKYFNQWPTRKLKR